MQTTIDTDRTDQDRSRRMFETASRLLTTGKSEDALTVLEYLILLEPTRPEYWVAGGMARLNLGHLEEAAVSFQVAEAADGTDPVPVLMRAMCRFRQGRAAEGVTALRRAHSLALAGGGRSWITATIEEQLDAVGDRCALSAA
jgi:Flp pilus assembly protein TadD